MSSLSEKAMMIHVTIKGTSFRKLDRKATQEVNTANNASHDAGRYNKALIAKEHLKDITRTAGAIRAYHYANTLPWKATGGQILATGHYLEYIKRMNELIEEHKEAADNFIQNYSQYVDHAKNNLGKMFNPDEYPALSDIRGKFIASVSVMPLPVADDFRVDLQDDITKEIRANIEKEFNDSLGTAMKDIWHRLRDAVTKMHDKMKDEDAKFKSSLFSNLCELCELLDKFNITDDPNLRAIRIEIEDKLCDTDPDNARHDTAVRKELTDSASDILETMAGYC